MEAKCFFFPISSEPVFTFDYFIFLYVPTWVAGPRNFLIAISVWSVMVLTVFHPIVVSPFHANLPSLDVPELSHKASNPSCMQLDHPIIVPLWAFLCDFQLGFCRVPVACKSNCGLSFPSKIHLLPQAQSFISSAQCRFALMHTDKLCSCICYRFYVIQFPLIFLE